LRNESGVRTRRVSRYSGLLLPSFVALLAAFGAAVLTAQPPVGNPDPSGLAVQADGREPLRALPFDHILRYDELTALLKSWAKARPDLVQLESIGLTPEGRQLWFLTLTNRSTGPANEKPALLVDGNMHALEWTGGVAALNFIWKLLRDHGTDERVTRLLDTRSVYVLPRLSPDGVEATLRDGRIVRSVIRPGMGDAPGPGLRMRDIDGDGRIVFMRFHDPNGPWKTYPGEPRLLVPRGPDEPGGDDAWRVVPEGVIEGYDGATIPVLPALEGLDFGTSFPDDRGTPPSGGTPRPKTTVPPEVAAYVATIMARPNIVAHVTCHSFGGGILMPPVNTGEQMPAGDRLAYAAFGAKATELTTYNAMSYFDLRAGQGLDVHIPTEIGWLYNVRGIFSFITEFWNPLRAAGIRLEGVMSAWLGGLHPVEDELKLLRWNDEALGGAGFVAWHAFDHPQLGRVEIGGWDKVHYWFNVPFERLEKEVAGHADWLIYLGLASPRIEIRSFDATPTAEGHWRVRLVVENTGWLPTSGSQRALDGKLAGEIEAKLTVPNGVRLVNGELHRSAGQLAGRNEQRSTATWWGYTPGTPDRAVLDWVIAAPAGAELSVTASHVRAGTARARCVLRPARER
jgi:hypothetical protein